MVLEPLFNLATRLVVFGNCMHQHICWSVWLRQRKPCLQIGTAHRCASDDLGPSCVRSSMEQQHG
jgi:hypothetical protein